MIRKSLDAYGLDSDEFVVFLKNDFTGNISRRSKTLVKGVYKFPPDMEHPHNLYESFTRTSPVAFKLLNGVFTATTWKELLVRTWNELERVNPGKFKEFVTDPMMQGNTITYFGVNDKEMKRPVKIRNTDVFAETKVGANEVRDLICMVLRKFDIKFASYEIYLMSSIEGTSEV